MSTQLFPRPYRTGSQRGVIRTTGLAREGRVFLATFQRTSESSLSSPLRLVLLRLRTADGGREKSAMAYRPTSDVANKIARERIQQLKHASTSAQQSPRFGPLLFTLGTSACSYEYFYESLVSLMVQPEDKMEA